MSWYCSDCTKIVFQLQKNVAGPVLDCWSSGKTREDSTEMERITNFNDVPKTDKKLAAARERLDMLEKQMSMRSASHAHSSVSQHLREERSSLSKAVGPDAGSNRADNADAATVTGIPDRPWAQALIIAQVRSLRC